MKHKIGVLGCGWLGLGLAQSYKSNRFVVHGSRQSKKDAISLQDHGIIGFPVKVSENHISGNLSKFLDGVNRLFLTFPPGLKKNPKLNYGGGSNQGLERIKITMCCYCFALTNKKWRTSVRSE